MVDSSLAMHPTLNPRPWLFPNREGKGYTSDGSKSLWNRVQQQWAEQGGELFTWHEIRAKALTDARRLGRDAQRLAGHASSAMTDHYIKAREIEEVTPLPEKAWAGETATKRKYQTRGTGQAPGKQEGMGRWMGIEPTTPGATIQCSTN